MLKRYLYHWLFCACFIVLSVAANSQVMYNDANEKTRIGKEMYVLKDAADTFDIASVAKLGKFERSTKDVPNFGITSASYWLKIPIKNNTEEERLIIDLMQPIIDEVEFYSYDSANGFSQISMGEYLPYDNRYYNTPDYLFNVRIPQGETRTFFMKIRCKENMQLPMSVGSYKAVFNYTTTKSIASGIYIGIMVVMILYNTFIFFIFRDTSYIKYALYIVLILLTQTSLQGYPFQYLWPDHPIMAIYSPFLFPTFVGIIGLEFFKDFLKLRTQHPKIFKASFFFLIPYTVSLVLSFTGFYAAAFMVMEVTASGVSMFMLGAAFYAYKKGFMPARFFLVGWSIFLLGIVIYVLKDFEVLPYNNFSRYTMHFGSGVEVILLSFALADRINILKAEKEASQALALEKAKENERILREQNIILETKVEERTIELKQSNTELSRTLGELKEAQTQLVESEKMASLGQLTAGIAHEINNPINFVSSNVKPLQRDVDILMDILEKVEAISLQDLANEEKKKQIEILKTEYDYDYLKEEISFLLKGITDGSTRTAGIVKGLRIFSRVDEDDIKLANIAEGLDSTIIILNNLLNNKIEIVKDYAELPLVECYPGKLNQVFLNMISNAIYAVKQKFGEEEGGRITISTRLDGNNVAIAFTDNGSGMDDQTQKKLFEPFFTTKPVGEGTGLGLSIAYNTIKKHEGKIEVKSKKGEGTTFTIAVPIKQV